MSRFYYLCKLLYLSKFDNFSGGFGVFLKSFQAILEDGNTIAQAVIKIDRKYNDSPLFFTNHSSS